MEAKLIEQLASSALIVIISLIFMANSDVLYGEGWGRFIVSNAARFGFAAGLAWFGYELWLFIRRKRFLAALTALAPNREELDRRLADGQSINDIARDFHQLHDVPERYTVNLALEEVRRWLVSEDPEQSDRARRFIAGQTVESNEPPASFLDRIREDSVGIYVDRAVLCYHRSPGIGHFEIGEPLKEPAHDDAGTLLLTTAYLYFLCHKPKPRISGPWHVSFGRLLIDVVRYPLGSIVQMLQDMVPWLGETISIGTKLQIVLGHTFSARQVRVFKKQFGFEGSFAIPLARIESLAITQPFRPVGNLEVSYVGDGATRMRVWFRSQSFAADQQSRRNWVVGKRESVRDWAQDWIDRIRLIALGEGRLIGEGPAGLPDWLVWHSRPVNVWNRGDQGPLSNTAVAEIRARAPWAVAMLLSLLFAIWSAPVVVFILLVRSGNDPVDWLETLGTWWPALLFVGIAAWIASFALAMKLAAAITHRFFPRIEPRDHFEFWHKGPVSVLKSPAATLKQLGADPDALQIRIDRSQDKYRTPPVHTRLAVGEMVLRSLEADDPDMRELALRAIATMTQDLAPQGFPAEPSLKTNIYRAQNVRLEKCDGLEHADDTAAILIGLDAIHIVAGADSRPLGFDDFDDLTPETIDRLAGLLAAGRATALPLQALREVKATAPRIDDRKRPTDLPMRVQLEFAGEAGSRACCFGVASHYDAFQLMGIVWCAAVLVGNILVWSETELRLFRKPDRKADP